MSQNNLPRKSIKVLIFFIKDNTNALGQEDTLEKEMATHSRTPAWKSPWTEEPGGLQSMGSQRLNN